jgi:hypothetical protein
VHAIFDTDDDEHCLKQELPGRQAAMVYNSHEREAQTKHVAWVRIVDADPTHHFASTIIVPWMVWELYVLPIPRPA